MKRNGILDVKKVALHLQKTGLFFNCIFYRSLNIANGFAPFLFRAHY